MYTTSGVTPYISSFTIPFDTKEMACRSFWFTNES